MAQVTTLRMLGACLMLVLHALRGWLCYAVPVTAADRDVRLQTQHPQNRPVFQRATKFRDVFAYGRVVLFQNFRIKGDG